MPKPRKVSVAAKKKELLEHVDVLLSMIQRDAAKLRADLAGPGGAYCFGGTEHQAENRSFYADRFVDLSRTAVGARAAWGALSLLADVQESSRRRR